MQKVIKTRKGENKVTADTDNIILRDAKTNKTISEENISKSQKYKIFGEIDKAVNDAADNGERRISIPFDINHKVEEFLTQRKIRNHYESLGYVVDFLYPSISSQIKTIYW